ncbi:hypothetical protein BDZ88DRAFT_406440 [Geranomyces variabilis]|nr:hypothetical protein BDZ88DRAFT_406440 [Geranomyces variabilis]KAJ3139591.1 hypothetical protein HDU90_009092 [Geranomyces variabilis]
MNRRQTRIHTTVRRFLRVVNTPAPTDAQRMLESASSAASMSAAVPTSGEGNHHNQPPAGFSRPNGPPKGPRDAPWKTPETDEKPTLMPINDNEGDDFTTMARSRRTKRSGKCEWATLVDSSSLAAAEETDATPPSPPFRRRKSSTYSTILRTYARPSTVPNSYEISASIPSDEPSYADLGRSKRVLDDLLADMEAGFTINEDSSLEAEAEEEDEEDHSPYRLAPFSFSTAGRPRRKLVDVYGDARVSVIESDSGVGAPSQDSYDYNDEDLTISSAAQHRKVGRSDSGYASDRDTQDAGVPPWRIELA